MAKTPEEMAAAMVANLAEKTGRALPDWLASVKIHGATKHGEIVKWLKSEHGVTHGYANLIAHHALNAAATSEAGEGDDLVVSQYASGKEALLPIYEALRAQIARFGADVDFAPKKAYVSVRRTKQFALIQPSTRTRVDVGIQLPDRAPQGRLEASGSFNAMVSHRVRIGSVQEVDAELLDWLREAYERA